MDTCVETTISVISAMGPFSRLIHYSKHSLMHCSSYFILMNLKCVTPWDRNLVFISLVIIYYLLQCIHSTYINLNVVYVYKYFSLLSNVLLHVGEFKTRVEVNPPFHPTYCLCNLQKFREVWICCSSCPIYRGHQHPCKGMYI